MQANATRNPKLPAQLSLDTVSPATRLLEKRRQMFEVQEALDAQKEEFERCGRRAALFCAIEAGPRVRHWAGPPLFAGRSGARCETGGPRETCATHAHHHCAPRRETAFKRREDILKNKDRELQESLIKFNKFLQDNDSKRNRAEKKERDEIKLRQQKEGEITRLASQLGEQQERRSEMMTELSKMVKFSHYLDNVLQHEVEFGEVSDIIAR